MLWLTLWIVVLVAGALGAIASANSLRFGRRVAGEASAMWGAPSDAPRIDGSRLEALPQPVRRYLARALGQRERAVRRVRLRHGGTFRPRLDGGWLPIRGEQYFNADPPGFVWWGRCGIFPGLWIEARDRSVDGAGSMLIKLESTLTLADAAGPELGQAALLRLLGEMAWLPAAFLDERYVSWSPVDERRARATLRVKGREVTGLFAFGEDALVAVFQAERYRDLGGGRSVLTPFSGELADYREVDGLVVPHRITANWIVDGNPVPYARFEVERIEYDPTTPF